MSRKRCPCCFEWMDAERSTCPFCGKDTTENNDTQALPKGTVIANRYEVGMLRERSEFVAYYAAFDRKRKARVILAEFFPIEMIFRTEEGETRLYRAELQAAYNAGMHDFMLENSFFSQVKAGVGIVPVLECFLLDSVACAVSDWYDESTFPKLLSSMKKPLPYNKAISTLHDVMAALAAVHAQGGCYGGVCAEDLVKSDAAVWRLRPRPHGAEAALRARMAGAKIAEESMDPRKDVHDVAALLYHLLTGKAWEKGQPSAGECVKDIPRQADAILMRSLAEDCSLCPESMQKLLDALSGAADPITAILAKNGQKAGKKMKLLSQVCGYAGGTLLVAGLVLGTLLALGRFETAAEPESTPVQEATATPEPTTESTEPTLEQEQAAGAPEPTPVVCNHGKKTYSQIDDDREVHEWQCTECPEEGTEPHESEKDAKGNAVWNKDKHQHYHICSKCEMRYGYEDHAYDKNGVCTVCGRVKSTKKQETEDALAQDPAQDETQTQDEKPTSPPSDESKDNETVQPKCEHKNWVYRDVDGIDGIGGSKHVKYCTDCEHEFEQFEDHEYPDPSDGTYEIGKCKKCNYLCKHNDKTCSQLVDENGTVNTTNHNWKCNICRASGTESHSLDESGKCVCEYTKTDNGDDSNNPDTAAVIPTSAKWRKYMPEAQNRYEVC